MISEIQYTSIRRVLDNLLEHPLLRDVTLEQAIRYTIRFISLHGFSKMYQDKIASISIKDFRGVLPCDLVSIIQVKDKGTGIVLRAMTNTFVRGMEENSQVSQPKDLLNNVKNTSLQTIRPINSELSFKTQGRVIFTSFPEGELEIAYKAIPVDGDGFPLLIDNENYLAALEAYIKVKVFTIKFDTGKISAGILSNAQTEYAWAAGKLGAEFSTPSYSEAQTLANIYQTLIVDSRAFDKGFEDLGNREYIRRH